LLVLVLVLVLLELVLLELLLRLAFHLLCPLFSSSLQLF
jgi:hypothetical protein